MWSSEGECYRTSDGVVVRRGVGTQKTAIGITYSGKWSGDKVTCVVFLFFFLLMNAKKTEHHKEVDSSCRPNVSLLS